MDSNYRRRSPHPRASIPRDESIYRFWDDYDPYKHRYIENPISNKDAFISLVKCAIGIGCLALPRAFANTGWLTALISTIGISTIVIYSLHLLLGAMYELCKRKRVPQLSYAEAMDIALQEGPKCLHGFHSCVGVMVDFTLAFYHFGVSCVYVVFIANNLKDVGDNYLPPLDSRWYISMLIIPLILMYMIRHLKGLVPYNMLANILLFFGFLIIFYYIFHDLPPLSERKAHVGFEEYPLFFGTVLFAIESVGVIISIESKMQHPEDYLGLNGVLNWGLGLAISLYVVVAFFGYWRYGDSIAESITQNLPAGDFFSQMAKLMFAFGIFFSYALQNFVTITIIWPHYTKALGETNHLPLEYVMRVAIVLGTVLCAMQNPHFALILSLVGAFFLSHLGLTFPAIMDLCIKYTTGYGPLCVYLLQDIVLITFGVVGCVVGTWASVENVKHINFDPVFADYR